METAYWYTEGSGFASGQRFNVAMMAMVRSKDEETSSVGVFSFFDGDLTVAAKSEGEARDLLDREAYVLYDDGNAGECSRLTEADLSLYLFEDYDFVAVYPEPDECDGEENVVGFREALDIMLVDLSWEPPFVFTDDS